MRRYVDLHTHSTASDGSLRPEDVIALADADRLAAVAITDHDTTGGLPAAARAAERFEQLIFVPGVEISARFAAGTMHLLGLGIDAGCDELAGVLGRLRRARDERNQKILSLLRGLGIDLSMAEVISAAGRKPTDGAAQTPEVISRLHIAEAMRRKGLAVSVKDAFERLLAAGRPAYVDKERLAPAEAIEAIHAAGGLAVLAHPCHLNCRNRAQLTRVVRDLIADGLDGMEVYHSDHTSRQVAAYLDLARRWRLAVTGGSDFHGLGKPPAVRMGRPRVMLSAVTADPRIARIIPAG